MPSPPPPPPTPRVKAIHEEPTPPIQTGDGERINGSAKAGVDIDWDDEDEATTVFDRSQEDAVRSLLRSAPPAPLPAAGAPPPPRIMSPPPPPGPGLASASRIPAPPMPRPLSAPPPSMPSMPRAPVAPLQARTMTSPLPAAPVPLSVPAGLAEPSPFDRGSSKKTWAIVAAAALAVGLVAIVLLLLPKEGSLVVTVSGPGNRSLTDIEVYVDNQKKCDRSPCQVRDIEAGTHLVRVSAPGYEPTADQAVKVASGDEAVHNVTLTRGGGTGLSVKTEARGLKLFVDDKEIGLLPQDVTDLSPGEHTVRIDGGERYEAFEKRVTIEAGQVESLDPKLKVKKGLATIKPGMNADDARVVLVSGSERRPVPQLPLAVDIPIEKPYSIVATKKGFQDFEQKLEFEDGQAERTFVIDLVPAAGEVEAAPSGPAVASGPRGAPRGGGAAAVAKAQAEPKAAGNGSLSLNSVPPSNVILDGKPLGPTPKTASVAAGAHTVIFVHPEHGRKAKSVNVAPGKTVPVVVKFK